MFLFLLCHIMCVLFFLLHPLPSSRFPQFSSNRTRLLNSATSINHGWWVSMILRWLKGISRLWMKKDKSVVYSLCTDVTGGSPPVQAVWAAGHPDGGVWRRSYITPHALWQSELQDKPKVTSGVFITGLFTFERDKTGLSCGRVVSPLPALVRSVFLGHWS